jgi:hypothetical protein
VEVKLDGVYRNAHYTKGTYAPKSSNTPRSKKFNFQEFLVKSNNSQDSTQEPKYIETKMIVTPIKDFAFNEGDKEGSVGTIEIAVYYQRSAQDPSRPASGGKVKDKNVINLSRDDADRAIYKTVQPDYYLEPMMDSTVLEEADVARAKKRMEADRPGAPVVVFRFHYRDKCR